MNGWSRLTVRTKLTASFVLVALIAAIIGAVGLVSSTRIHTMVTLMHDVELEGVYKVGLVDGHIRTVGREVRSAVLLPRGERDEYVRLTQQYVRSMQTGIGEISGLFHSTEGRSMLQRLEVAARNYEQGVLKVLDTLNQDQYNAQQLALNVLLQDARPSAQEAQRLINQLWELKLRDAQGFEDDADRVQSQVVILVVLLTLSGVIVALLLGLLIARSFSRQLGGEPAEVAGIAEAIAKGDLTVHINTEGAAPHSIMAQMAAMEVSLRRLVGSVLGASNSIASGASQIAAGNTDLSQRTEEQAANLTETASAMEQLAGTVRNNADVAQQAAQRAMAASRSAQNGGEVVNNVVDTMADINEASKNIVDIISVIDSIAFQTNILALNAAVEAARAGEQGRGFAVVAGEVRSLAQKSAAAAKDIKLLIDDSVEKIEVGSKLVDQAGETMAGIVNDVRQVTDLISEISAATSEQTTGISQVNEAVLQLSDVTQQNAALVEESAAASGSLNEQAQHLVELVRVFRVDAGQAQAASGQTTASVISVPPAVIEDGVPRSRRPASAARGYGGGSTGARPASAPRAASTPAAPEAPPAAARPAALGSAATAKSGSTVYGPGASKEDDWEEF